MRHAALAPAALVLAGLALTGCETTAEKSAKLERRARHVTVAQRGLAITHESLVVKVVASAVLHSSEGAVAVVTVRSSSPHTLHSVPIAITVTDARGRALFQNNAPGLEAALVSIPSLVPHEQLTWVDDQIPANGEPAAVSARIGETLPAASVPKFAIDGVHLINDPSNGVGATGTVSNHSAIAQRNLAVFAVARRGSRIVAAARGVLPELAAGSSKTFQMFFVGDPRGAQLLLSAPATTFK